MKQYTQETEKLMCVQQNYERTEKKVFIYIIENHSWLLFILILYPEIESKLLVWRECAVFQHRAGHLLLRLIDVNHKVSRSMNVSVS